MTMSCPVPEAAKQLRTILHRCLVVLILRGCLWSAPNNSYLWFVCPEHIIPEGLVFAHCQTAVYLLLGTPPIQVRFVQSFFDFKHLQWCQQLQELPADPEMKITFRFFVTTEIGGWNCSGSRDWTNRLWFEIYASCRWFSKINFFKNHCQAYSHLQEAKGRAFHIMTWSRSTHFNNKKNTISVCEV